MTKRPHGEYIVCWGRVRSAIDENLNFICSLLPEENAAIDFQVFAFPPHKVDIP